MAEFSASNFMKTPDQDVFDSLIKDDLLVLADFLELSVKRSWRKIDMQKVIVKYLISVGVFDESSLSSYCTASEVEIKRLEMQAQLEFKKLEIEQENKKLELEQENKRLEQENRKYEIDKEIELKKLELQNRASHSSTDHFDITKHIKLVPPFQEEDVDKFFLHFEKIAENLKWPKDN